MNNLPPGVPMGGGNHSPSSPWTPGVLSFAATVAAGHNAQSTQGTPSTAGVHSFAATGNHVCLVTDTVFGIVPHDTVFPTVFFIVTHLYCAVPRAPAQLHLYQGQVSGQGSERGYQLAANQYPPGQGQTNCENCWIHALLWLIKIV